MLSTRQLVLVAIVIVIVGVVGFVIGYYSWMLRPNNIESNISSLGNTIIRMKAFDVDDLIRMFNHSKIILNQTYSNGTSTHSYIVIDKLGLEEINNTPVYRVRLEAVSGENKSIAFIWITRDFSKILLFRSGGVEYANKTAEYYGRIILSAPSFLLTAMEMNILFDINISNGRASATTLHWNLTSLNTSTITLKGHEYKVIMGKAVKAVNSTIDRTVWFKAVNINGTWYLLYVRVMDQDGTYTVSIEELS